MLFIKHYRLEFIIIESREWNVATAEPMSDLQMTRIINDLDKRSQERESQRLRILYGIVGLLSFFGVGTISTFIEYYSKRAVEERLELVKVEFDRAILLSRLVSSSLRLDIAGRPNKSTDRVLIAEGQEQNNMIRLLVEAAKDPILRAKQEFDSVLHATVDSFVHTGKDQYISVLYDLYSNEFHRNPDIAINLARHYGLEVLSSVDSTNDTTVVDLKRFQDAAKAAEINPKYRGLTAALRSLTLFKSTGNSPTAAQRRAIETYKSLDYDNLAVFLGNIKDLSNPNDTGSSSRDPDGVRIAEVAQAFAIAFNNEIKALNKELEAKRKPKPRTSS